MIKKPGKPKKKKRKIEKPKDLRCRWCDIEKGTECYRHAEDPEVKFLVGGGITGGKIPDNLTVWGCAECDLEMSDRGLKRTEVEYLEWQNKWKLGIIKTWLIDY